VAITLKHTENGGMQFANSSLNAMTPEEIGEVQLKKLRRQLRYCIARSPYYRERFDAAGATPEDINSLADFRRLPIMMTKETERDSQQASRERHGHPFGMHLCASLEDLLLTSTTSGTTGVPTFTYTFTRNDLEGPVADLWAFMFRQAGVKPGDRVLFAYALGVYATSMLLWGIRRAGALPIDVDVRGGSDAVLSFGELTRPAALATTPSMAEYLVHKSHDVLGHGVSALGLSSLLLCGEPGPGIPEVKSALEAEYAARVYDYWAPGGLGFGMSCDAEDYHGLHCYAPDYNLYQDDLVDPETKTPIDVIDGAIGEAVHTSLDREACPVVRYAYGDIVQVFTTPCPNCGFAGKRLKFIGRTDDMLIVKGANVYPSAFKELINRFRPRTTGEMRVVLTSPPPRVIPPLKLKVEFARGMSDDAVDALAVDIQSKCRHFLKVTPEVIMVPAGSLGRSLRKTSLFEKDF
jgi:phenylacetate-CoA ligase